MQQLICCHFYGFPATNHTLPYVISDVISVPHMICWHILPFDLLLYLLMLPLLHNAPCFSCPHPCLCLHTALLFYSFWPFYSYSLKYYSLHGAKCHTGYVGTVIIQPEGRRPKRLHHNCANISCVSTKAHATTIICCHFYGGRKGLFAFAFAQCKSSASLLGHHTFLWFPSSH